MLAQIEYYTQKSSDNHVNHRVADISLNSLYRRAIYSHCVGVVHWKQSPRAKSAPPVHIPGASVSC